jgi:membrane protein implicated in regulation of membrane protease activity
MQPLIAMFVVCVAAVVLYPPAALVVFVAAAVILGFATWRKTQQRDRRNDDRDPPR